MLGNSCGCSCIERAESQLVSMFCAQFSFFVMPVTTCMMGAFTSTFCDYLYSSLCWNSYMGIKYSLYNAAASLFTSWFSATPLFGSLFKMFVRNYFCFQILDHSKSISFFHVLVTEIYSCKISLPCCCRSLSKALLIYCNMVLGCTRKLCSSLKWFKQKSAMKSC